MSKKDRQKLIDALESMHHMASAYTTDNIQATRKLAQNMKLLYPLISNLDHE